MREELRKLVDLMPNAGLAVFLAAPFSTDTAGKDYEVAGPITVENARSVCVNPDADFFVVGSRAFTEALRTDLRQARHHSLPSSHAGPLSAFTRDGGRRSQTSPAPVKFVLADSVIFQNGLHFYLSVRQYNL